MAIIAWIWLKDVVDLTWEIWRLRRLRAAAVRDAPAWADYAPIPEGRSRQEIFDSEDVGAARLVFKINHYQVFDKLLASAELRRDRILAQLEFHVAQRLREAAKMVEGNFDKPTLAAA